MNMKTNTVKVSGDTLCYHFQEKRNNLLPGLLNFLTSKAAIIIVLFSSALPTFAQDVPQDSVASEVKPQSIVVLPQDTVTKEATPTLIEGYVSDSTSSGSLGGAVVIVEGTEDGATADSTGKFSLTTTKEFPVR